jgi:hypothetical protein
VGGGGGGDIESKQEGKGHAVDKYAAEEERGTNA